MSRTLVGLLAAVGVITSVLAGLIRGHLEPLLTAPYRCCRCWLRASRILGSSAFKKT